MKTQTLEAIQVFKLDLHNTVAIPRQWNFLPKDTAIIVVGAFPLSMPKIMLPNLPDTNALLYIMGCKGNNKEGSANNSGFLAPTTVTNTEAAETRTSRGKHYGQGVLQRLRHFLHYKNKLLFCLPRCSPLFICQAACTWQFRKLCTWVSTESGLPQWSMWRFRT